jgi:hypothetical protein
MAVVVVAVVVVVVVIIIIIIIIIIIVSFMQSIHTYILETNHVPSGCIVAAILSLLFMVPVFLVPVLALLFSYVSTFIIIISCCCCGCCCYYYYY